MGEGDRGAGDGGWGSAVAGATIKASIMSATPIQARRHTHARTHTGSHVTTCLGKCMNLINKSRILLAADLWHTLAMFVCVWGVCESIAKELVWFGLTH